MTANIFLRKMRGVWKKADPLPSDLAVAAARELGIVRRTVRDRRTALALLQEAWKNAGGNQKDFPDFEAALVRRGIELRRRRNQKARGGFNGMAAVRAKR